MATEEDCAPSTIRAHGHSSPAPTQGAQQNTIGEKLPGV